MKKKEIVLQLIRQLGSIFLFYGLTIAFVILGEKYSASDISVNVLKSLALIYFLGGSITLYLTVLKK